MARRLETRGVLIFFLLAALPIFGVFPYVRAVNNPNEFTRVFTCMAVVERGTFAITEEVQTYGWVNDMARVPRPTPAEPAKSDYFMVKAPAGMYLGLPAYAVWSKVVAPLAGVHRATLTSTTDEKLTWLRGSTWALRLGGVALPCFLFLIWFERYLRAFSGDVVLRLAAVAAVGLGTNYLAYVHMFASHAQYAAAAFLAFALVERELRTSPDPKARRPWMAFFAGLACGGTVLLEYHALFSAVVLAAFAAVVFRRPTRLAAYAAGGLVAVALMMLFQWRAYGNPLTPGHQMLETQKFAEEHKTGLWGVVWPTWEHTRLLLFSPGFGLVGMSPYMALGALIVPFGVVAPRGGYRARRNLRWAALVATLVLVIMVSVNAGIIEWRAGWTVGPRYLAATPPFVAFGALVGLEALASGSPRGRAVARGLSGGLAFASVVSMGLVSLTYDTLPENIARPFAQFTVPLVRTWHVPHHVGEWFGFASPTFWFVCAGAMLLAVLATQLRPVRGPVRAAAKELALRATVFVAFVAVGLAPAFSTPEDGSALFVLHPSVQTFPQVWEPAGRDRVTKLREALERAGGERPCGWYRLETLYGWLGQPGPARAAAARAKGAPRDACR